jgi:Kdo2-lipid IVA lauroyltransferase/acyltransferase
LKAVVFYITLPFLYGLSLLPWPLFYGLSDFFFFLLYHVIGYRRKVVYQNLKNSFPDKSHQEIKAIERKFYRYLCDLFLETFKTLTISEKEAKKRCQFTKETIDLFDKLEAEKKSCIIVMGHFGNWEWAGNSFALLCKQKLYVIYHPLHNTYFNTLIYDMRTRFGNGLYAMRDTIREMIRNRNEVNATAFIADQTAAPESAYWTKFMNQDTPVFWGTEKIAIKMNFPVVYVSVFQKKRGHYEAHAKILVAEPKLTKEGEITELHTRKLEEDIIRQPEIWLWSHRRWKHRRPEA